jgi:DNA polymerase-3 subunit epsilon/ATP-dependent DNA helicase DinG
MRVLAKVMLWLPNTLEGDGDALFIPTPGERRVWYTISAANEGCDPEHCRFFHSDTCFFYRARAKAEAAHLVIVNHALLLADVAAQNRVLPEYELLIVDEAHHLERATTESLRFSVSWQDLGRAFDSLLRPGRSHPSLLDEVAAAVERLPRNTSMRARQMIVNMRDAAHRVQGHLESLFTDVEILLNDQASGSSRYGTRLRITEELRHTPKWEDLAALWSHLAPSFDDLVDDLSRLGDGLEDLVDVEAPELENVRVRLLGATRTLATAKGELESFIKSPDENGIYWLESRYRGPMTVNAVPLHVGPLVQEHLFAKKRSIVLTSATLQIENSFDYLRERLGMGRDAMELAVGSPFDYPEVALLYVVSDIPEPGTQGYQKNVEETLIELLQATDGRALVLFTSYSQLRATTEAITTPLAHEGITVYAQGTGTSRAQLLESFRTGERVVLMGTRSFWEGVDVTGEALSCLVIVKLPFDVPNDPIVASRAEMYENAFNDYMVPEAVLRFLQGFGRLIRTAKDQGIAVVLDRRILTKRYGRRFVDSLPDPRLFQGTKADLPAVARRWLAGQPLPSTMSAISEDEPWVVPPPEEPPDDDDEPPWFWGA